MTSPSQLPAAVYQPPDWYDDMVKWQRRAIEAEATLKAFAEGRDVLRASHVVSLGKKVKRLRQAVRDMQVSAEEKNRTLFATGLIVQCTGCDAGAPDRFQELTEARVQEVERLAKRLRTWWSGHKGRLARKAAST